jgi:excinuclease ABC subunit C
MINKPDNMPMSCGVYEFADADGNPLYVGKASNINERICSYFSSGCSARTRAMLGVAHTLTWVICSSEQEALLLEREKIKNMQPPYNIKLREGSGYSGIGVSIEKFPRVYPWRGSQPQHAHAFGPYPNVNNKVLMRALVSVYKVRSCSSSVYQEAKKTQKACLLFETGDCLGPCLKTVNVNEYAQACADLLEYLKKPKPGIVENMRQSITGLVEAEMFERAALVRDNVRALESLGSKQSVVGDIKSTLSVWSISRGFGFIGVCIIKVVNGIASDVRMYESIDDLDLATGDLYEYIINNYRTSLGDAFTSNAIITKDACHLGRLAKTKQERNLVDLAEANSLEALRGISTTAWLDPARTYRAITDLRKVTKSLLPFKRIECIDISHSNGSDTVGSLVVFDNGKLAPKEYRIVKLDTYNSNDYAAISEIVRKRFTGNKLGLGALPDLLIIDGGKGQVSAGIAAHKNSGSTSPIVICGLAKKFEELYVQESKNPVLLESSSDALMLLILLRNAAHNHALRNHRDLKNVGISKRAPLLIEGIGFRSEQKLYEHFTSLESIINASQDALAVVIGQRKAEVAYLELSKRKRIEPTTL